MFNGSVFVDQLPDNESNEPAIHFYTRPFDLSSVKPRDSLTIYTTAHLRSVMIYDKESGLHDTVEIINEGGVTQNIELSNQETVWVKAFSCNSKTLNIVILFEYRDHYTLYAGRFITSNSELFKDHHTNKGLRSLMQQMKIDDLYIDLAAANINEFNLHRKACQEIESILKDEDYEDYTFLMLVDDFGYEDLIFNLAKRGIKIYLDDKRIEIFKRHDSLHFFDMNMKTARIVLVDKFPNDIRRDYEENKIAGIQFEPKPNFENNSKCLRVIQYSVHPTLPDVQYIANITAPRCIYPIGDLVNIPFDLQFLCRFDDDLNKENQCFELSSCSSENRTN